MQIFVAVAASTVANLVALGTLMKWLLDSRIGGVDKRLDNLEGDVRLILGHLLSVASPDPGQSGARPSV